MPLHLQYRKKEINKTNYRVTNKQNQSIIRKKEWLQEDQYLSDKTLPNLQTSQMLNSPTLLYIM